MRFGFFIILLTKIIFSANSIENNGVPTASFSTSGDLCPNSEIDFIDNSSTTVGTIVLWAWDFGDGNSSNVRFPSHTYTSSGSYNVRLTVVNSNGDLDEILVPMNIGPAPIVSFEVSNTCASETQIFSSMSSVSPGSIDSYLWDFDDGNISTSENPTHSFGAPGVYNVTFSAFSAAGCEGSVTEEIIIYEDPVALFSSSEVCLGESTVFNNESSIINGNLTYSWDFGDGNSSSLLNPSHTYSSSGVFSVTLTATSTNGSCVSVANGTATVNELPVADFNTSSECDGDNVVFTNNSTGDNLTFFWDFGDNNTSTSFEPSHVYDLPGSYIVELEVTSDDECSDSFFKRVDIYQNPSPIFFIGDACLNDDIEFSNLTNEQGNTYLYDWDFGDSNTSSDKNPTHTYSTSGTYTVVLTATTSDGCSAIYTDHIKVSQHPQADFSVSNGCDNELNTFNNETTINVSETIDSYEWDYGDGSVSSGETGSHTYDDPGIYDVTLRAVSGNSCDDIATKQITIFAKPIPDFLFSGECDGNNITFSNESTVSEGTLNYLWNFGDGDFSTEINPTHEYATEGTYTVSLEARNNLGGCNTIIEQEVEVFQELSAEFDFTPACFGEEVVFDNQSIGSDVTFLWNFGDGNTSTNFEPTHLYESPGSYISKLTINSEDGCVRTHEARVDVYENPLPVFFTSDACENEEVFFTNLTDESAGIQSYLWNFGDGNSSSEKEPTHTYSVTGVYDFSLTVTTADGCENIVNDKIEIYETPTVDFSVVSVCNGEVS